MKKLILITSALMLTSFAYAGEGDAQKSCNVKKQCCCCKGDMASAKSCSKSEKATAKSCSIKADKKEESAKKE